MNRHNELLTRRRLLAFTSLVMLTGAATMAHAADNPKVTLTVENRGDIVLELYQSDAPKTVAHFLALVNKKFYDGILFHRVRPGFMAQVGDPKTKGMDASKIRSLSDEELGVAGIGGGGSGQNIPFETNNRTHEPGTIAMALNAPASATGDSQFFINLVSNHRLDAQYCVFGKVIKGMDVVKSLQQGDKIKTARAGDLAKSGDAKKPKGKK
jgi:peptidyl-prolyl cis-trans isomerase B (cyclophilin B)